MSRLAQALRHHDTGRSVPLPAPFRFTSVEDTIVEDLVQGSQYVVTATFKAAGVVPPGVRPHLYIDSARRMITGEVFGEYEQPLRDAEYALMNLEVEKARQIISRVLRNFHTPTPLELPPEVTR